MQIHYGDQHIDQFPTDEWKLIERFAQEGLLKQEVWSSRLQWLGVKAKIEIPLSGTGFNVRQNTLHIENLPESWPMDTESAWRERFCKVNFTFQDIVEHLQAESFTDDIFEGYENTKAFRRIAVFNEFWPQGHLDYARLWKGNTVPQLPPKSWTKVTQQHLEDILLYAPGKDAYRMPLSHFMDLLYSEGDMGTATPQQWLLYERRNQAAEMRKQITGLMHELCQSFSGTDCDKIMDLLVTQCHGMLQQYVDDMQLMIHHTIAAAIQLGISPLTQRVDPATLTGPARTIAQALLREAPVGCTTHSLRFSLQVPLREGAVGGAPLAALFLLLLLLRFFASFRGPPCPVLFVLWLFCRCSLCLFGRIGQSAPAMVRCRDAATGSNATNTTTFLSLLLMEDDM